MLGASKNAEERLAASGAGHTLRCCDLGMILALLNDGVCDGGHSTDVMKRDGQSDENRGSSPLKPKEGLNGPPASVESCAVRRSRIACTLRVCSDARHFGLAFFGPMEPK